MANIFLDRAQPWAYGARMAVADTTKPPPGFTVARSSELDPLHGRSDRWGYRGQVNGWAVFGCGRESWLAACLAAWAVVGGQP